MVDRGAVLIGGLGILGLLGGLWLLTNYQPQSVGIIFTVISAASILVTFLAGPISHAFGNSNPNGASEVNIKRQIFLGAVLGVAIFILSLFTPLTIGIPSVNYAVAGSSKLLAITARGIISILVAPIIEEVFFLFVVPFLIYSFLVGSTKNRTLSTVLTVLIGSTIFALFHYAAYGATLLLSGAFLGAAIFRFIALSLVVIIGKNRGFNIGSVGAVIITTIIMHAIFNAVIFASSLVIAT